MTDATATIMVSAVRREMEETRETMVTDHSARTVTETEETMDSVHTRTNGRTGTGSGRQK